MKKLYFNGQSSAIGDQTGNWRSRVASLVAQKSVSKAKDPARPTSNRTQIVANLNVQSIFGWLRTDLGFGGLANPYALDERHFVALAGHIGTKKEMGQIGSARAAGYATYCRHLARWIDKPELVAVFNQALGKDVCKRSLIADRDKSWSAAGLDTEKKITEIMKAERWVGIALACQKTFGMRKREILMFQPFTDIRAVKSIDAKQQDGKQLRKKRDLTACHWKEWVGGITIDIVRGTKGKRPRCLYIEPTNEIALEFAWQVLQEMNAYGDRETLGPSQFTLQQNSGTYERALIKFGITQKESPAMD
jgi:hypothetical protein